MQVVVRIVLGSLNSRLSSSRLVFVGRNFKKFCFFQSSELFRKDLRLDANRSRDKPKTAYRAGCAACAAARSSDAGSRWESCFARTLPHKVNALFTNNNNRVLGSEEAQWGKNFVWNSACFNISVLLLQLIGLATLPIHGRVRSAQR
jgi:hypothetical protein